MKTLTAKMAMVLTCVALAGFMFACDDTIASTTDDVEVTGLNSKSSAVEVSSSSEEESSSSAIESSSEEAESSSETAESSSEIAESSESEVSSSSEVSVPDKVSAKDTVVTVSEEDVGSKVEASDLPENLTSGDSLVGDDLYVGEDDLDFDKNDYYCQTPDGEWYVLEGSKYDNFWAKLVDILTVLFTGESWLDYSEACDVIYVHPKS